MALKHKRWLKVVFGTAFVAVMFCAFYVRTHPLVFNESFFEHAHCIRIAEGYLVQYAHEHNGHFPYHTNGYGDAVLLIPDIWLECFSGPGYDTSAWKESQRTGGDVPETQCGRVYVQGLSATNDPKLVLLFDKMPSPGDHRHFFSRIGAPMVREVLTIGGGMEIIPESQWPEWSKAQIELLVVAGITRQTAEMYYTDRLKK